MGEDRSKNPWVMAGRYASLGVLLPVNVFAGYAIGYLLDKIFATNFFYIVFLLLGIAAGFVELIRKLQKDARE